MKAVEEKLLRGHSLVSLKNTPHNSFLCLKIGTVMHTSNKFREYNKASKEKQVLAAYFGIYMQTQAIVSHWRVSFGGYSRSVPTQLPCSFSLMRNVPL